MSAPPIDGTCDARFSGVRDAFRRNFAEHEEVGAAVCIRSQGAVVVDLWGGHTDPGRATPWRHDTLVNAYSVGKGVLAALVLSLVERGQLAFDDPVVDLWPEFAPRGKSDITLRMLLAHRAGLPAIREPLPDGAWADWRRMCDALAGQAPFWEPDSLHGYHVNTFGFLVGELVCRAVGQRDGEALQSYVAGPCQAEFHWSLPRSEHPRVATTCIPDTGRVMTGPEEWGLVFPPTGNDAHDTMVWHGYFNPRGISGLGTVNSPEWRLAEIPSTNGHGTARAVAAIYDALLERRGAPRLAGESLVAEATTVHSDGDDRVLGRPSRFGLGFQLSQPGRPIGPNLRSFGHYGYGGSLGFADPEADLAFGYLMNRPGERWQTPRAQALVDATYEALSKP